MERSKTRTSLRFWKSRLSAAAAAAGLALALPGVPALAAVASLEMVGRSDLGGRGLNAGLALAGSCAYVGSRGDGPVAIVDISDPANPRATGEIPLNRAVTPREVRAFPDGKWLVVLNYPLAAGYKANSLDFYRWGSDCLQPAAVGKFDFGAATPHEMYLWRDPRRVGRALIFVTMFGSGGGDLRVIDASDPAAPRLLATGPALPAPLHSIALDPDGRRAYLSDWTGGLMLADTSELADAASSPQIHLLTTAANAFRTPLGNVHSAVPVPDRQLVVTTDERYPGTGGCPYGPAHLVDVSDPAHPRATATLAIPENDPQLCPGVAPGTWTSHNPTLTQNLALISWYSGGLQVFDISDAAHPVALTELRPSGSHARLGDPSLGSTATLTWSYPIVQNGLVYVADINQGLLVLRYHGPHEEEISRLAFAEGNSNLTRLVPAASPTPSPPAASPTPARPVPNTPARAPAPAYLIPVLMATALVAGAALFGLRRRLR